MDESDIQRFAETIINDEEIAHAPREMRARFGHDFAVAKGLQAGLTDAGAKDLGRLVKRRIEFSLWAEERRRDADRT